MTGPKTPISAPMARMLSCMRPEARHTTTPLSCRARKAALMRGVAWLPSTPRSMSTVPSKSVAKSFRDCLKDAIAEVWALTFEMHNAVVTPIVVRNALGRRGVGDPGFLVDHEFIFISYTHLTLPTIYSV